jgi:hypothetical protein
VPSGRNGGRGAVVMVIAITTSYNLATRDERT